MMIWSPMQQSWATCEQAMKKLLLPTEVTPFSFSVARLIVTPSRMHVRIADHDLRVAAAIADILRLSADDDAGIDVIVLADGNVTHDGHVVLQPRAATDTNVRADDAERTDFDIDVDFGAARRSRRVPRHRLPCAICSARGATVGDACRRPFPTVRRNNP